MSIHISDTEDLTAEREIVGALASVASLIGEVEKRSNPTNAAKIEKLRTSILAFIERGAGFRNVSDLSEELGDGSWTQGTAEQNSTALAAIDIREIGFYVSKQVRKIAHRRGVRAKQRDQIITIADEMKALAREGFAAIQPGNYTGTISWAKEEA
jgi:hypothetical protein